jgi:SAM-dependent methyltransferase
MQPASRVTIGSSLAEVLKAVHNRNVPELSRLPGLDKVDTNIYTLGEPINGFVKSSELSPIQEEISEDSYGDAARSSTAKPQIPDSKSNDFYPFGENGPDHVPFDPLPEAMLPTSHISSVGNTNLSPQSPSEHVGFAPTFTPIAEAQPAQSTAPSYIDSPAGETSDEVSFTESPHSVFEDLGDITSSYTASLLSDVKNFTYENGRRYHSYREGRYLLPNDEPEQDRQDLLHHVRTLVLHGRLFQAPLSDNIQRILDIGTGTGIWAIDAADFFPSAQVIGTDLSPIQPSWVPPNCRFIVDDAEADWLYSRSQPFDYIHARDMGGAIADWSRLLAQSFQHLRAGGWIELCEFEVMLTSDDDSMAIAPTLCEFLGHLVQASMRFNRPMNVAQHHRQRLIEAGFEDVRDEVYKVRPLFRRDISFVHFEQSFVSFVSQF